MASDLEQLVRQAKGGDRKALEGVVLRIQDKTFGLALRMLGHPEDAEDEAQEILIKVITHLSDFREESAFSSWVYRIACNHLLTTRTRKRKYQNRTFGLLEEKMSEESEPARPMQVSGPERDVLLEEARVGCMQAVLACLDKEMRVVFILGEIYGVTGKEGAFILGITPEAFRKRLSRSRKRIGDFMMKRCGLVNENNACRCHKMAARTLQHGQASPPDVSLVNRETAAKNRAEAMAYWKELSEIDRAVAMFRRYPEYQSPESFAYIIKDLIDTGNYEIFH